MGQFTNLSFYDFPTSLKFLLIFMNIQIRKFAYLTKAIVKEVSILV